jgi:tol-pal system protein YbgF
LGRLPESEARTATAPPAAPEPAAPAESSTQTAAAVSTGTPREQYAHGFGLLRKANYDEAEIAFAEFLKNNPDDPLADNARYWLGETYYARGQYAPAAEAFLDAYQKNKAGSKAPDALLKLGMSLGSLNKVPEACATYQELRTALPDAPVSIKNKAEQERRNLRCK